jgi:glutathione S-transferase
MKLYYSPGACSLAAHIVLHELALEHTVDRVNLRTKKTATGADFTTINSKGYVPALQLESGEVLTEGVAILQYLADLKPDLSLAPANGTMQRYRLMEWLGYINSEIHKSYSPLFNPVATEDMKSMARSVLARRYGLIADLLKTRDTLLETGYSVADIYLYTTLTWADRVAVDLAVFSELSAFRSRISARPAVVSATAVEFGRR